MSYFRFYMQAWSIEFGHLVKRAAQSPRVWRVPSKNCRLLEARRRCAGHACGDVRPRQDGEQFLFRCGGFKQVVTPIDLAGDHEGQRVRSEKAVTKICCRRPATSQSGPHVGSGMIDQTVRHRGRRGDGTVRSL